MDPMLNIAVRAARSAARIIMRSFHRRDELTVTTKEPNDFVSEVDRAAEAAIIQEIHGKFPQHAILAEESGQHSGNEYEWIIDPLDGTTNYLHGFPQFAISIGLRHRGLMQQAVVYDPLREELFTASRGRGALLNDRRLRVTSRRDLRGALLGTGVPFREDGKLELFLDSLRVMVPGTAGVRRPGSAALDFAYVAAGRLDGFWEFGLSPWDFAAGALLVVEAGGTVTDMAGGDRFFDTGNAVAGNLRVHQEMLERLKPLLGERLKA
ncbi:MULTISPECIES: inositol monophosphatase family protein [Thiorhodovibrio]|uniref:inositol monophosphatase family protein n=1 Tax=Thiorhodovibrio TaxID=61593 RepID=UPI001912D253|nr:MULTISPECIES: inositol monophosphatase family protein [Thiorhodovibrio]MBK5970818.1 inositol monophosphatase [Thiorhodovibrio winogradskyi]WPL10790.1 Inositol-1-monophosphatase [Thiorhodovibrio litoralis]